ncbi:MAG: glycosyltransferase, partial [Planctomycetota bacterium]
WLTLVINALQKTELLRVSEIPATRIMEIGTYVENEYFVPITPARKEELRRHLGYILGHGERIASVEDIEAFETRIPEWMSDQQPTVCGAEAGLSFDFADAQALWFLQPTRVVPRKRIPRNWDLIAALFAYPPFRLMFEENPKFTLTLHVSGPVPAEHEGDLRDVTAGFRSVLGAVARPIARRIFLALSAGKLGYATLQGRGHDHLSIADLYHLADLVMLPSSTEGRGLPILEAAAAGLPLICSRYEPREVFEAVIGRKLKKRKRLEYIRFPEDRIGTALLQEITDLVFLPWIPSNFHLHNRRAMAARFSMRELTHSFGVAIDLLAGGDKE